MSKTVNYELVGKNIKRVLKEKHIRQYHLENMTGYSKGYISKIITNVAAPKVSTIQEIAVALDVDVREFFKPEEELGNDLDELLKAEREKAIEEFATKVKLLRYTVSKGGDTYYTTQEFCDRDIDEITEQLKGEQP